MMLRSVPVLCALSLASLFFSTVAHAQGECPYAPNGGIDMSIYPTCTPNPQPTNPSAPYYGGGGPANNPGSNPPPSDGYSGGGGGNGPTGGQQGDPYNVDNCRDSSRPISLCVVPVEWMDLLRERLMNWLGQSVQNITVNGSTITRAGFMFWSETREMYRKALQNAAGIRSAETGIWYTYCLCPNVVDNKVIVSVGIEDMQQANAVCHINAMIAGGNCEAINYGPYFF